jgi:perosamine synthetase
MSQRKIHYAGPWITEAEVAAVADAAQNGFYENYRLHASKLEKKICEYLGVRHCLAVNSGTAAMHLGLASLGIGPGDEVIVPDASCVATALAVAYTGATPIFADVDPETWCLAPDSVRRCLSPRSKALMPVHWNGHPCAMDDLLEIAQKHQLVVMEDGAPALGAEYRGRKVGTLGDTASFSFQGAKIAIAGQGGAFVTNRDDAILKARQLASYGRTDSVMTYWSDFIGFNYGMPNLPAALAAAQMDRIEELLAKKRQIWAWYEANLGDAPNVKLIREGPGTKSTYCYPPMLLKPAARVTRAELFAKLKLDNIDARPAQPRQSPMPMFQHKGDTPVCALIETHGVLLPGAFCLTEEDVALVCRRIRELT